jgi:hypothetical protein
MFYVGKEMVSFLTGESITSLMHRLDRKQNLNLFKLIRFLSRYHSPSSQKYDHEIMDSYGNITRSTNYTYFREKVGDGSKEFRAEYVEEIPEYIQMLNLFNSLPNYEQRNIENLAWFILYCKNYNLDSSDAHNIWKHYQNLIEQIQSLPNY